MIRLRLGLMALAAAGVGLTAAPAQAQIEYGGEKVIKVVDLPDTPEYAVTSGINQGRYVDIGGVYKQFKILWLPLHNYEVRWVGYVGTQDSYQEVDEQTLRAVAAEAGVPMPAEVPIPFWDAWGGKLVFGGIILLIILIAIISGRRKKAAHYPPNYPPNYPPQDYPPNYPPPPGPPNYPPQR